MYLLWDDNVGVWISTIHWVQYYANSTLWRGYLMTVAAKWHKSKIIHDHKSHFPLNTMVSQVHRPWPSMAHYHKRHHWRWRWPRMGLSIYSMQVVNDWVRRKRLVAHLFRKPMNWTHTALHSLSALSSTFSPRRGSFLKSFYAALQCHTLVTGADLGWWTRLCSLVVCTINHVAHPVHD